jgi:hypothetical protein
MAKFLRWILIELGLPQSTATRLYENNDAAVVMANAKRPTERSRHVDIKHFALQQLVHNNDVLLEHVRGAITPSEALAKALEWILHHRNCSRVMGMMGSPYTTTSGRYPTG